MDKKLIGLVSIFLLFFGVFMSLVAFQSGGQQLRIRATSSTPSCENSFVFASDVEVAQNENVSIIAFIRDRKSVGLQNIPVTCQTDFGSLQPAQSVTTDKDGKSDFLLSSQTSGIATISCQLSTCQLPQTVSVRFNP